MRKASRFVILAALTSLTGCASIIHGTQQDVGLSSSPTSAKVTVNGRTLGQTPVVAKLARKDNHVVKFELDGYAPTEMTLTRGVSGWVWGNIVFGGVIGLAVDAMTGGLYKLTPEQLNAQLGKVASIQQSKDGSISVAVVMQADPAWQRVGQLPKE